MNRGGNAPVFCWRYSQAIQASAKLIHAEKFPFPRAFQFKAYQFPATGTQPLPSTKWLGSDSCVCSSHHTLFDTCDRLFRKLVKVVIKRSIDHLAKALLDWT